MQQQHQHQGQQIAGYCACESPVVLLLLFAAVCFPQSHYRHYRALLERAEEAAQVPDEELLQRPVFEVLVDRAGLNQKTEANSQLTSARFYERHQQALRDRKRCLYSTLVVAQANAARAACVAAAAEREAAAAAAAAEAVAATHRLPQHLIASSHVLLTRLTQPPSLLSSRCCTACSLQLLPTGMLMHQAL